MTQPQRHSLAMRGHKRQDRVKGEKDSGLCLQKGKRSLQALSSDAEEGRLELLRPCSSPRLTQHLRVKPTPFYYTDQTWIEKNGDLGRRGLTTNRMANTSSLKPRSYFACWL